MKIINGWTLGKVIDRIEKYVPIHGALRPSGSICVYQTEDGGRCAVGAFLPEGDGDYLDFEGSVVPLLDRYPELKGTLPFSNGDLKILQRVHDDIALMNDKGNVNIKSMLIAVIGTGE